MVCKVEGIAKAIEKTTAFDTAMAEGGKGGSIRPETRLVLREPLAIGGGRREPTVRIIQIRYHLTIRLNMNRWAR